MTPNSIRHLQYSIIVIISKQLLYLISYSACKLQQPYIYLYLTANCFITLDAVVAFSPIYIDLRLCSFYKKNKSAWTTETDRKWYTFHVGIIDLSSTNENLSFYFKIMFDKANRHKNPLCKNNCWIL